MSKAHTAAVRAAEVSTASYRERRGTPLTESLEAKREGYAIQRATLDSRLALRLAALNLLRATAGQF